MYDTTYTITTEDINRIVEVCGGDVTQASKYLNDLVNPTINTLDELENCSNKRNYTSLSELGEYPELQQYITVYCNIGRFNTVDLKFVIDSMYDLLTTNTEYYIRNPKELKSLEVPALDCNLINLEDIEREIGKQYKLNHLTVDEYQSIVSIYAYTKYQHSVIVDQLIKSIFGSVVYK